MNRTPTQPRTIEIIVDSKGNSQVQTKGFVGSECLKASQFVEQALGQQTSQRTTAEFFQTQVQSAELQLVPKANQN